MSTLNRPINTAKIEESISMLKQYLDADALAPLLSVLQEMTTRPDDAALVDRLFEVLNGLGILQGAVLTYAPYLGILTSERQIPDDGQPLPNHA